MGAKDGKYAGESVSNMISSAGATGAMASAFFWPCMHLWMPGVQALDSKMAYCLLGAFQMCFGLFLMAPVIYLPNVHALVVALFCVAAVAHLTYTLWFCAQKKLRYCKYCIVVAVSMIGCLVFITVFESFVPDFPKTSRIGAWWFYVCEAVGLSAIALFPCF